MSTSPSEMHLLYGLRIASQVPLYQDRLVDVSDRPDIEIRRAVPVPPSDEPPAGRVLAELETDRRYYTFTVADDGSYRLRFYGTCDFTIDADLRVVTMQVADGADAGVAGVLAAGAVLSFVLTMRGHTVLHASAVQTGDAALAFVGRSGMGKSTMAALMCASGASLISDDVLRLDPGPDSPWCRLGATELRLRKAAAELAERFADRPASRVTADARDALRLVESTVDHLPLAAAVVPVPDRERDSVSLTRLAPVEALLTLLQFPRLLGWVDPAVLDRQFQQVGELVEQVPVFLAHVPWGPPFGDGIASALASGVGVGKASLPGQARKRSLGAR